ncbi:hypothetical protein OHV56_05980 [Acinetobacter baumannii]|nr:hypothetical protein [Acinetobacter baumannii]
MSTKKTMGERDIATAAAVILQECFIKAARNEKVLYVENDILWSKTPDEPPVFIKKLTGRNPNLPNRITYGRIFKIKKHHDRTKSN